MAVSATFDLAGGEVLRFSLPHGWEKQRAGSNPEALSLSEVIGLLPPDSWPEAFRAHNAGLREALDAISQHAGTAADSYELGDISFFDSSHATALATGGRVVERLAGQLAEAQRQFPDA